MGKEEGTWHKVFCPEDACMSEEERIDLPVSDTSSEANDAWVETL